MQIRENVDFTEDAMTAVETLQNRIRGDVLTPDAASYDSARQVWNGMFDRRPSAIVQCVGTADVITAVSLARENGISVTVRGGGHNSAGTAIADDTWMIDLSAMRRVNVDPHKKIARVDGGALLGDVDVETQLHGLAVSSGIVSHTGVGGLTLGGGFGWISRSQGLSIDNLLAADVVTADGRVVRASADENPDLFWGIRGGGGNFGIVTSLELRCAEIGREVYSGLIVKPFEEAKEYIAFHRDFVRGLPDEMTVWMVLRHAPPLPFLPEAVHGQKVVILPFVWLGDPEKGVDLIQPLREHGETLGEGIGMHAWTTWQSLFDGLVTHGARNYWKSHHLESLEDDCVDRILELAGSMPTEECEVFIPHMEGAPSRVEEDATAFAHRYTPFLMNVHTRWRNREDDARCIAWARAIHEATEPFARGVYVNFLGEEGDDRVKQAYSPKVWSRLVEVKRSWDPDNFFRFNQNIRPS
ncbi:MAG: FAD-binding oxidoreductase [Planctomycetota bacterium]